MHTEVWKYTSNLPECVFKSKMLSKPEAFMHPEAFFESPHEKVPVLQRKV